MRSLRLLSALLLVVLAIGSARAADERLAVPSVDDQAKAEKLIRQLFLREFGTRTRAGMQALAGKLLDQAAETKDDPTAKYVLYREAAILAAKAIDLDLAEKAAGELTKQYAVSGASIRAMVIETAAPQFTGADLSRILAEHALAAVAEGFENDDYDAVARLLKVAEPAARTARSVPLISAVSARTKEVETLKAEFDRVKKVLALLQTKPDDPEANLAAGKYFCFRKGAWDKGLPHLTKGSDAKLKELATKDLAKPAEAPAQLEQGEVGWLSAPRRRTSPRSTWNGAPGTGSSWPPPPPPARRGPNWRPT